MEVEGPATLVTPTPAAAAPGLYDATLRRSIADRSLHDETIFECVLSIPHTQYQVRRRSIYYPGRLVLFGLFLISLLFFCCSPNSLVSFYLASFFALQTSSVVTQHHPSQPNLS